MICPFCREPLDAAGERCPHCAELLVRSPFRRLLPTLLVGVALGLFLSGLVERLIAPATELATGRFVEKTVAACFVVLLAIATRDPRVTG